MVNPLKNNFLRFVSVGGTIDKIYFDSSSRFEVGDSQLEHILSEALVTFEYDVVPLMRKDSLEMTEADRELVREFIRNDDAERYVITHGTDTLTETATALEGLANKTIVLTGALSPARFRSTDATFNVGLAVASAQVCGPGVYVAMSGQVFAAGTVRKNKQANCFQEIEQ